MSVFNLLPSDARFIQNPEKKKFFNQYMNEYNYYNKSSIKLGKIRQKLLDEQIKEKREELAKLKLPKMLYSNFHLGNLSQPNFPNETKVNKDTIEKVIKLENETTHASKPYFFDDLFNAVDRIDINGDIKEEPEIENKLNEDTKTNGADKGKEEAKGEEGTNEKLDSSREQKYDTREANTSQIISGLGNQTARSPSKGRIFQTGIGKAGNTDYQVSVVTELSNDSVVNRINNSKISPKDVIHFNNYGKYKFTDRGVSYPRRIDTKDGFPVFEGNTSKDKAYYDYRKKRNNPSKIYNPIGSFSEKFNKELARISRSYGKEESRGRFITNPVLEYYHDKIPYYDLYKDIKFIENRYADNKRYKFKLLPLINTRLRNFDRLGAKVYQSTIAKRGLFIDTRNKE